MKNGTKRQLAFYAYSKAVQAALGSLPDSAQELLEDLYSEYQGACAEEGFEYEEGWEFPAWNKPEFRTYEEAEANDFAFPSEPGETVCISEPQEGLAFLCNLLVRAMPNRTEAAFESFGNALKEFVEAPEGAEAEAKLAEAAAEPETAKAMKRAGFEIYVPQDIEPEEIN